MLPFEYVSVIISVVIGLGVSQLLTGVVELVKSRERVRFYWLHLLWVVLTFLGHIFLWWSLWGLRNLKVWNFFSFLLLLSEPMLLYAAAAFIIPRLGPEESVDARQYFYDNRRAFFGLNAAFCFLLMVQNGLLSGGAYLTRAILLLALAFVLLCVSAVTRSARWHAAVGVLLAVWFLAFVVLFGLQLGAP